MARRYVRVCVDDYGTTDDAEQQLADARAKARSLARGIADLERRR